MIRLRVREIAEARGMNKAQLARRADIGFSTVKRLWKEPHRHISTEILEKVAHVLGVPTGSLIEDIPEGVVPTMSDQQEEETTEDQDGEESEYE